MPMVVPWMTRRQSASCAPAWSTQRSTPSSRSRGVLSALLVETAPVASSRTTRSVKVPPMSTPILCVTRAPPTEAGLSDQSRRLTKVGRSIG